MVPLRPGHEMNIRVRETPRRFERASTCGARVSLGRISAKCGGAHHDRREGLALDEDEVDGDRREALREVSMGWTGPRSGRTSSTSWLLASSSEGMSTTSEKQCTRMTREHAGSF
jgi:hypothetical protein